jgi:hypothetical protein
VEFALRIEVEILFLRNGKKDWNGKPGEPFGENAHLFIYTTLILCLETKNQNSRLYQIILKI